MIRLGGGTYVIGAAPSTFGQNNLKLAPTADSAFLDSPAAAGSTTLVLKGATSAPKIGDYINFSYQGSNSKISSLTTITNVSYDNINITYNITLNNPINGNALKNDSILFIDPNSLAINPNDFGIYKITTSNVSNGGNGALMANLVAEVKGMNLDAYDISHLVPTIANVNGGFVYSNNNLYATGFNSIGTMGGTNDQSYGSGNLAKTASNFAGEGAFFDLSSTHFWQYHVI